MESVVSNDDVWLMSVTKSEYVKALPVVTETDSVGTSVVFDVRSSTGVSDMSDEVNVSVVPQEEVCDVIEAVSSETVVNTAVYVSGTEEVVKGVYVVSSGSCFVVNFNAEPSVSVTVVFRLICSVE